MVARHISRAIFIVLMSGLVACVFEPAKRGYSQDHVKTTGEAAATPPLVARFQDQRLQGMG